MPSDPLRPRRFRQGYRPVPPALRPAAGEAVNEIDTYPVIVLKMERREESVVFKM